jgi:uncharacterized protein
MKKLLIILLVAIAAINTWAQDIPERPNPPTLVTDFANILDASSKAQMEAKLVEFFRMTSTQIAVVTVPDLKGYDVSDFAFQLGEKWGVGSAKFNNGIVILVKPKTADSRGQAFIATGYGLEGAVPDATARQIVDNEMIPRFKNGDMAGGINRSIDVLIALTKGEYNYQQYAKAHGSSSGGKGAPFIVLLILIVVLSSIFRRRRGSYYSTGTRSSLPFWIAMGMMGGSHRHHSGFFDDFSSGSGSFGGGGSSFGSFGGFGGGSFGGGGAGGSW